MRIEDIWNRFLLMSPDMATQIDYEYDGDGMITKETRQIINNIGTVTKKVEITYTRDGSGNVTKKTVNIITETTP